MCTFNATLYLLPQAETCLVLRCQNMSSISLVSLCRWFWGGFYNFIKFLFFLFVCLFPVLCFPFFVCLFSLYFHFSLPHKTSLASCSCICALGLEPPPGMTTRIFKPVFLWLESSLHVSSPAHKNNAISHTCYQTRWHIQMWLPKRGETNVFCSASSLICLPIQACATLVSYGHTSN